MDARRLTRVREMMAKQGLDQLLVSAPESVWYLTGVAVDPGERLFALVLDREGPPSLVLNRLFSAADVGTEVRWYEDTDDPVAVLRTVVRSHGVLGVDKEWPARFLIPLEAACPDLVVKLGSACVDACRAVKDAGEVELMRTASRINDETIEQAFAFVHAGVTEAEVADFIASRFHEHGAGLSFPTIVSFGAHAADPHHAPDATVVEEGQCVLIDMGCRKDRYCSDMTRTRYFRKADGEQLAIHALVREANAKAEAMVRPGVPLKEIDAAARDLIAAAGYGPYFNHRLGHFIGQTDHEQGDVSASSPLVAQAGMIFSIEPGIYLPGRFGVRIEDLVLVTEDGCEVLNHVDKQPLIIG